MRTRSVKLSALMLVLLIALSGCSLIEIDQEMENAETAAEVGGVKITRGDVIDAYNYQLNYTLYMYNMLGIGTGTLSNEDKENIKNSVLDSYITNELVRQKAVEMNLSDLSDESFAEADEEANSEFDSMIETYREQAAPDAETDEEAREATITYLEQNGVTLDSIIEEHRNQHLEELVREEVIKDITVTDEDIQAKYDEQVAADEASYASNSYQFEQNTLNGTTITWMPEGYRTVKHILFKLTDEQSTALSDLNTQLGTLQESINNLESAQEDAEADATEGEATAAPDESTDETAEDEATAAPDESTDDTAEGDAESDDTEDDAEPAPTLDELNAQKADLEQQIADKKAEIIASFKEKTDDVYARLDAGESFDALMEELGEDPGMQTEPSKSEGYYVCATSSTWDVNFRDAAMALENVGDVSEPVLSSSGVHIIYYNSDVTPGPVDLETVRDALSVEVLTNKQDEAYDAQFEAWKSEANIKKYPKVLP